MPTKLFDIPQPTINGIVLPQSRQGKTQFTVNNISGRPLHVRARLTPIPDKNADYGKWLKLDGDPVRDFRIADAQLYAALIAAPPDGKADTYTFRLDVWEDANPDDTLQSSPSVNFTVLPPPPPPPPTPWRTILLIAAAVLVVIVIIIVIVLATRPQPPATPTATATATLTPTAAEPPTPTAPAVGDYIQVIGVSPPLSNGIRSGIDGVQVIVRYRFSNSISVAAGYFPFANNTCSQQMSGQGTQSELMALTAGSGQVTVYVPSSTIQSPYVGVYASNGGSIVDTNFARWCYAVIR